jgi:tol-pal system protein YbgF
MRSGWIVALALGVAGCSTMTGGSRPEARTESSRVEADQAAQAKITALQRQAAMTEAELKLLRRQMAALQVEVERLASAEEVKASSPGPSAPRLEPRVEAWVKPIETSDLEPERIEPSPATPVAPEVISTPLRVTGPGAPATLPPAGQAIYDQGYTLYHQGRFIDAESSFHRFLQSYSDSELADNAQFWIGESRFARDDYMGALLAFQEVLDAYPSGNKVADALLKVGDCLVHLDNGEAGRERYEEVLRRFPGSAAAAMAEERLNRPGG